MSPSPERSLELSTASRVAIAGAGSMGAGIAQVAALAGHTVQLLDAQPGAAGRAVDRIAADLQLAVARGRLEAAQRDAALARLSPVARAEQLEGCSLAVEAIVESLEAKQALLRELERALGPAAILATNTSSLSITAIAQPLQHPERVVGWHFFNPATRMKLVEVVAGLRTDPAVCATLRRLSAAWGKTAVEAPNLPGFIVNRVAGPYYAEALRLRAEGTADMAAIDMLLRQAGGFAMGPFELMDLIGHDVNLSVTESVWRATGFDARYAPHPLQQELVRAGRLGRKSGEGFYRHDAPESTPPLHVPPGDILPLRLAARPGALAPLARRFERMGAPLDIDPTLPEGCMSLNGPGAVRIALTDGRTATERGAVDGIPTLLLDLALDAGTTPLLGIAAGVGAESWLGAAARAFEGIGIALLPLADVAGLVVMRTVCCLCNEAAELLSTSTAEAQAIDRAMQLGTAYPLGPLAWGDQLGAASVAQVLANLQSHYGEPRYRRAPALSRAAFSGVRLHG